MHLTTCFFLHYFQAPVNDDQRLAQDHCISIILTGARKTLSNVATVELYETSLKSVRKYHKAKLADIEIDGKKFRPPVRVLLNCHNIPRAQKQLCVAYKTLEIPTKVNKAPYHSLKDTNGQYYSIMNDGIQKFTKEFNGVFVRTVDVDINIKNLAWSLDKIPGGSMDSIKLVGQMLNIIHEVLKFRFVYVLDYSYLNYTLSYSVVKDFKSNSNMIILCIDIFSLSNLWVKSFLLQ